MKCQTLVFLAILLVIQFSCKKDIEPKQIESSLMHTDSLVGQDSIKVLDSIAENIIDTSTYNKLMRGLSQQDTAGLWPTTSPFPNPGAILPYHRIIAFYGNLYSKRMGILGELPEKEMLTQLQSEVKKWEQADSLTPVKPALHYIAVTAQKRPARGGKYRQRMPDSQIDKVIKMAEKIEALVFLDFQVGQSTLQEELPLLEKYFKMPNIHLGIDPEFSMKNGAQPGRRIGTFNAKDINYAINYLDSLVHVNDLPPKVLVVHRFTKSMVTNYQDIEPLPNVQVVVHMDGWGAPATKKANYRRVIYPQPVQFAGFKIFYKNDTKMVGRRKVMPPEDILKLVPQPIYIQYQ